MEKWARITTRPAGNSADIFLAPRAPLARAARERERRAIGRSYERDPNRVEEMNRAVLRGAHACCEPDALVNGLAAKSCEAQPEKIVCWACHPAATLACITFCA